MQTAAVTAAVSITLMWTRANIVISCLVGAAIIIIAFLRQGDNEPVLPLGSERIPPGEQSLIEAIRRTAVDHQMRDRVCATATFQVIDNLSPEMTVGIFQPGAAYEAVIRLSRNNTLEGFAVRLVTGFDAAQDPVTTQPHDILFLSSPTFASGTVADLHKHVVKDHLPFHRGGEVPQPIGKSSGLRFWSVTPSRFGAGRAAKFSITQCSHTLRSGIPGSSILTTNFADQLGKGESCFEFSVQLQNDARHQPIEDAEILWDEVLSPFLPIALLTVPEQDINNDEHRALCQNMQFNPWNVAPDLQPLGGINRARRAAYRE